MILASDLGRERAAEPIVNSPARDSGRPLVLVSNRGPVEHRYGEHGGVTRRRGSGGLVTALSALSRHARFTWVAAAMSDADRLIAARGPLAGCTVALDGDPVDCAFVALPPEAYEQYYGVFSNRVLWFLQHDMWDLAELAADPSAISAAWASGYVPANHAFARKVAARVAGAGRAPVIMLHDYHLYLAGSFLRRLVPEAILQLFIHIPWPSSDRWLVLPAAIRQALLRGILANDVVGLQTREAAGNFLETCARLLPEAVVRERQGIVTLNGRRTLVRSYPISIDVEAIRGQVAGPAMRAHRSRLGMGNGQQTIVRVDRVDPSKNLARGFEAFGDLLQRRADLRGRMRMLAFLVPSRSDLPEYERCRDEAMARGREVNARYGAPGYTPVQVFYENNREQALAAMQLYDVLLVAPRADGMNLVAKEGPAINQRDGVLVLSRTAGAHEQLGEWAVSVDPLDVHGISRGLETALALGPKERADRAAALRAQVERREIVGWLRTQMDDLSLLLERPERVPDWAALGGQSDFAYA